MNAELRDKVDAFEKENLGKITQGKVEHIISVFST